MSILTGYAQYTASKVGKTGLTVTVDVRKVTRATGAVTTVATGAAATELWRGLYQYQVASADLQTYDYLFVFITSDSTVDQKELPALWTRFSEAVATDANGKVTATLAAGDVSGNLPANVTQVAGQAANAAAPVTFPAAIGTSTYAGGPVAGVTAGVTLAANGLDAIPLTPAAGAPSTFRQLLVQACRKLVKKADRSASTGKITCYADDGTTALWQQAVTDDGQGNETQGDLA